MLTKLSFNFASNTNLAGGADLSFGRVNYNKYLGFPDDRNPEIEIALQFTRASGTEVRL